MNKKKAVGVIYQQHLGYLDHLAPLCSLLNIPLIVSEENIYQIAKKYYPSLKVILYSDYVSFCQHLVTNFDIIFSCQFLYSDALSSSLLHSYRDDFTLVWMPHGHSDKGWKNKIFTALSKEKIALVYGQKMLSAFKKQKVYDQIPNKFFTGNFREHYYRQNFDFYQKILKKELGGRLDPSLKTILYAPTWKDYENNSSFEKVINILLKNLKDFNLIVKPHPNTYLQMGIEMERLIFLCEEQKNIYFVKDFSHIFPLLDFCDIYLGDMSSIGYDFLFFNKPMFFLNNNERSKKDPGLFLYRCGIEIMPNDYQNIFTIIKDNLPHDSRFSKIRKKVYENTFDEIPNFKKLMIEISKACKV